MLKRSLLLLLSITTLQGFSQENYAVDKISSALKSRANAVIRDMETRVDMRAPDNIITTVRKVVTVLNKTGDNRAELYIPYDKSYIIQHIKGLILDASGNIRSKISQNNFSDESAVSNFSLFEDNRIKSYSPTVLDYPYTIIYEYEIKQKQNLMLPEWCANPYADLSVEKSKYIFVCKPGEEIRIKAYNYKGKPEVLKSEKLDTYTWEAANIPAQKHEPYAPNPDNYRTRVKVAAKKFSYYGHTGSYESWEELGKWEYDELIKDRQALPQNAVDEIKALVKDIDNDREKVKKIYQYVQQKTRYISIQIGIGGNQPMQATEVHQLSYGDCKALVNYTQSLLKAVDIPSLYCVVHAGSLKQNMDPDFASMEGNHIILCVPLKQDSIWLDCTSQTAPFGFLGDFTDDRTVLACTAEGGKIIKTPALSSKMNLLKRKADLNVSKSGDIKGSLQTVFSGAQYENYDNLIDKPYSEQLKLIKDIYDIDNIDFKDLKIVQDKSDNPTLTESATLNMPNYAVNNNNYIYLVLNAFNKHNTIPEVTNRTLPVYINRGFKDEDELIYHLPEGLTIEAKPKDIVIESSFGTYSMSIVLDGNKLTYKRMLMINDGTYPTEKYVEFVGFINRVSTADRTKAVFKSN